MCQGHPSGSSGGLPRNPTSPGVLFESSAHCPDRRNLFLCLLLLSNTKLPWPSHFSSDFLTFDRCVHFYKLPARGLPPTLTPRPLGKWPGRWCASPHPRAVAPFRGVDESAQCTFFICSQCQLIRSFPNRSFRKVCRGTSASPLSFTPCSCLAHQLSPPQVVYHDKLSEHVLNFEPTSALNTLYTTILTGLSPSFCWFAKSLSALIKLSQTPCGATCARNMFSSRRSLPIVLAAASRTPPVALLLSVLGRDPPSVVFKRESVTVRAHMRQGDFSLTFDWHDDPFQEVRASPQNILYNALSVLIFLLHLNVAFTVTPHAEPPPTCDPSDQSHQSPLRVVCTV